MDRGNHYETAFESYLQARRLTYVAIDEARRSILGDGPVKSLDFLVFGPSGTKLCVDIKGRRFPAGPPSNPRRVWECWSFEDDIDGLDRWSRLAGEGFRGLLVFAYCLGRDVELPDTTADLHPFRGRRYLFRGIDADDYRDRMRVRSPRWKTVDLPRYDYRALVRPFGEFVSAEQPEECPF
jgi:hypothetical protein